MGLCRAVLRIIHPGRKGRAQPIAPSPESLGAESKQLEALRIAKAANARASMGLVATAGQSMATESSVQAMLRGMLDGMDKGGDRDGRH